MYICATLHDNLMKSCENTRVWHRVCVQLLELLEDFHSALSCENGVKDQVVVGLFPSAGIVDLYLRLRPSVCFPVTSVALIRCFSAADSKTDPECSRLVFSLQIELLITFFHSRLISSSRLKGRRPE